ncbi:hypothetical protein Rhe02_71610 [Rhizocola hellebori]|uniref:DUF4383 domain-containing protein n=1 Tax=Rhizocola hellebori TaxID=1392758 RepID=A0A8J3QGA5_9ACTN|nr:DUF4383 domain-containing protein [Rhizocola hellebori]GIH09094.1 hypothetical protein Rhe02_71610 [Rhizocola hellebori]
MAHLPINHRLGGFYRTLAALAGLYLLLFGIIGASKTWGSESFFAQGGTTEALGLKTNPAFSLLSIVVGAVILLGALFLRNFDHFINYAAGVIFWVAGLFGLILIRTGANFLNFAVSTCVVSFIIGTVLVLAGMYGKRGTAAEAQEEEIYRHSGRGAVLELETPRHKLSAHPGVQHPKD